MNYHKQNNITTMSKSFKLNSSMYDICEIYWNTMPPYVEDTNTVDFTDFKSEQIELSIKVFHKRKSFISHVKQTLPKAFGQYLDTGKINANIEMKLMNYGIQWLRNPFFCSYLMYFKPYSNDMLKRNLANRSQLN